MANCAVLLPVYNSIKIVGETIDSILKQEYRDFNLIIVDDCSTDDTYTLLRQYEKKDSRITLRKNKRNMGVGQTLYNMFKSLDNNIKYCAQIGHDDIWDVDYLGSQIEKLDKTNAGVSFSKVRYIDGSGKKMLNQRIFKHETLDVCRSEALALSLIGSNYLCAPASVINLNVINKKEAETFWGYNNDRLQDHEFWLHLSLQVSFVYNKSTTCNYRLHENNFSSGERCIFQGKYEFYAMLRRVLLSSRFNSFIEKMNQKSKIEYFDNIIESVRDYVDYSKLLIILLIDLCEQWLNNNNPPSEKVTRYLLEMYQYMGMLRKSINTFGKLYTPIPAIIFGAKQSQGLKFIIENSSHFTFYNELNEKSYNSLCIAEVDSLEYLLNDSYFFNNVISGRAVVFCSEEKSEVLKERFPNLLIIDENINSNKIENMIIDHIQDKSNMYYNGFYYNVEKDLFDYEKFYARSSEVAFDAPEIVRTVEILGDIENISAKFFINDEEVQILEFENNIYELEASIQTNALKIVFDKPEPPCIKISVNNTIYILSSILYKDKEFVLFFKKLSYRIVSPSSWVPYLKDISPQQKHDLYEFYKLKNSRTFHYVGKIRDLLRKFGIIGIIYSFDKKTRR